MRLQVLCPTYPPAGRRMSRRRFPTRTAPRTPQNRGQKPPALRPQSSRRLCRCLLSCSLARRQKRCQQKRWQQKGSATSLQTLLLVRQPRCSGGPTVVRAQTTMAGKALVPACSSPNARVWQLLDGSCEPSGRLDCGLADLEIPLQAPPRASTGTALPRSRLRASTTSTRPRTASGSSCTRCS